MADLMGIKLPIAAHTCKSHTPCTKGVNRARTHKHGGTIGRRTSEIYHILPSTSIRNTLQTTSRYPNITTSASCGDVTVSVRLARLLHPPSFAQRRRATSRRMPASPYIRKPRHGLSCYAVQQRHPLLPCRSCCFASIAGRAARLRHIADQSVPPSSFTTAAFGASRIHPSRPRSLTRSRPTPTLCKVRVVCMTAACEEPSFRAAAAFGDGPLVIAVSVRKKLHIIAKKVPV
jgi:hypothetical protein